MMFPSCPPKFRKQGMTIVELLAATGIIAVLIVMVASAFGDYLPFFEKAGCYSNLRNLHISLSAYMQDNEHWPQPPDFENLDTVQEHDFWITSLAPYGMTEKAWVCRTAKRLARARDDQTLAKLPKIHYLPALFDEAPMTPFLWADNPWAQERANMHGVGILRIYKDGSIRPFNQKLMR